MVPPKTALGGLGTPLGSFGCQKSPMVAMEKEKRERGRDKESRRGAVKESGGLLSYAACTGGRFPQPYSGKTLDYFVFGRPWNRLFRC